jgi:hypothetical protein
MENMLQMAVFMLVFFAILILPLKTSDDYVVAQSLRLMPQDEHYLMYLQAAKESDEVMAAKISMKVLDSTFLDQLTQVGKKLSFEGKVLAIHGKYKLYFPNGKICMINFLKKEKLVEIEYFATLVIGNDVEYLMYDRPVALTTSYWAENLGFVHDNWSLYFSSINNEKIKSLAKPNSFYFYSIPDMQLHASQNIDLPDHALISFKLEGGHRVVTMALDIIRTVTHFVNGAPTYVEKFYFVAILAVDATDESITSLALYTKVDDHAYFISETATIVSICLLSIPSVYFGLTLADQHHPKSCFYIPVGLTLIVWGIVLLFKAIINRLVSPGPSRSQPITKQLIGSR